MIKLENTEVVGWEHAIRGMRNPMNSWEKSDSYPGYDCTACGRIEREGYCNPKEHDCSEYFGYEIGKNDHDLMMRLRNAGTDHRKFMRMITVYVDITAPLYWWKEFDTYKVGTVANSCSTMHKIADKEITLDDFSCEHLIDTCLLERVINEMNIYRDIYNNYDKQTDKYKKEFSKKDIWWQIIQILPSSYNQKRTVMLNYEVLANIYKSRKTHKLDEWVEFCKWIKTELPYSELITGETHESNNK